MSTLSKAASRGILSSRTTDRDGPDERRESRVNAHAIQMRVDGTAEGDLVRRAAGGDLRALEALYRAHVGQVYALCLRMVGDASRAEELTQDAWVRVWERLPSFRFESAFSTWLHRVACNVVLESERGRRRRERRSRAWTHQGHERAELDQRVVDRIALDRAVASLSPRARAVFVLHDLLGHSHPEVSRILEIAEGTSRAHLFAARQRLRRRLGP